MKIHSTITIKNKVYQYTLERAESNAVRLVSKDARIDQEFLSEDVAGVLLDLPNLILAEQEYKNTHSDIIRFRVSTTDKRKIEKKAVAQGFDSISDYLRTLALG